MTGTYRALGGETSFGQPVTENVSAPAAGAPIPAQGATAAAPVNFTVPRGVSVLDADMRWPDPTNADNNILSFILTDPAGRLAQYSYDYGAANSPRDCPGRNCSPDIQHSTVEHPMAGTWTAQIVWADGRGHAQSPPNTPGPYRGTVTFQASGQNFTTSPASAPVIIQPHSSANVPLSIALPQAPGDAPESVQFTSPNGLESSVPIARRTLIPSAGGSFGATLTSSVSRGAGQIKTFYVDVPRGKNDLDVSFNAPDHAADDPVYYYLFSPSDLASTGPENFNFSAHAIDATPTSGNPTGNASLITPDPQPGLWEIDVMQGATTDGTVFSQTVAGAVAYNQLVTPHRDRSPDVDVDDHRLRHQLPNHSAGHEHDEPRRVLRTATVGQRHHWRQCRHAGRAGGRSHRDADGDAVAHGSRGHRGERHPQRHRLDGLRSL